MNPGACVPVCERESAIRNGSAARQRLIEAGYSPDLVKSYPPTQAILLDEKRDYEIQRDERIKLLSVTLWQIDPSVGGNDTASETRGLFADFLPHITKLRRTQARLEQQIAILRQVEALRLHAAVHDGQLPTKLSDISVPLPIDPVTGKPFVYSFSGATAHIRGSSVQGDEQAPGAAFTTRWDCRNDQKKSGVTTCVIPCLAVVATCELRCSDDCDARDT